MQAAGASVSCERVLERVAGVVVGLPRVTDDAGSARQKDEEVEVWAECLASFVEVVRPNRLDSGYSFPVVVGEVLVDAVLRNQSVSESWSV